MLLDLYSFKNNLNSWYKLKSLINHLIKFLKIIIWLNIVQFIYFLKKNKKLIGILKLEILFIYINFFFINKKVLNYKQNFLEDLIVSII